MNSVVEEGDGAGGRKKFALGNSEEGVEDIFCFNHPYGCSQMGDDQENTRKVLAGIIHHPNAAGVLGVGQGWEDADIPVLMDYIGEYDPERIKFLVCRISKAENERGHGDRPEILQRHFQDKREISDASELVVGLKCGASDGMSGITANPTVGAFSDILGSKGGTTIMTEVPEMFGAGGPS